MNFLLKDGIVYTDGKLVKSNLWIIDGKVCFLKPSSSIEVQTIDCNNMFIFPGFVDVHTHLREPGFSYKETIKSGTMAGAYSGYSALFTMPNLKPVPDSEENLKIQQDIIDKDAVISVYPFASITKGQMGQELSQMQRMKDKVKGFSDDGKGVQNPQMMEKAMLIAKECDKIIVAHCEDESLLNGGYIHGGEYAKIHNHKGISSASEFKQVERDVALAKKVGVKYHVCHLSAKESVEIIRKAKQSGVDVTAETAPHYLVLNDMMIKESGDFKMNPPIRSEQDRLALIEGINDRTIEILATDHAPHSREEKNNGLKSFNGVVGLETAFPVIYTYLVKTGQITLEKAIEIMSINPAKRFGVDVAIHQDCVANLTIFDLNYKYKIDGENFISMGKSTPFNGMEVFGKCMANFHNGKLLFNRIEK